MPFVERTMPFSNDYIRDMNEQTEPGIIQKIKMYDERR